MDLAAQDWQTETVDLKVAMNEQQQKKLGVVANERADARGIQHDSGLWVHTLRLPMRGSASKGKFKNQLGSVEDFLQERGELGAP